MGWRSSRRKKATASDIPTIIRIAAIVAVVLTTSDSTAIVFDTIKPLLYLPTKVVVMEGFISYSVDFTWLNPCDNLPSSEIWDKAENHTAEIDRTLFKNMKTACHAIFEDKWLNAIHSLLKSVPHKGSNRIPALREDDNVNVFVDILSNKGSLRRKRGISLQNAAISFLGGFAGSAVSNFINTIYEQVNPNSNTNKIYRIEQQIERHKSEFAKVEGITANITETVEHFARVVTQLKQDTAHLMTILPKISFTSARIFQEIMDAIHRIKDIENVYVRDGRMNLVALGRLCDTRIFNYLYSVDTSLRSITLESENTITFHFDVAHPASDTYYYELKGFDYWDSLTEPTLVKRRYNGAKNILFNATANCVVSVDISTVLQDRIWGSNCNRKDQTDGLSDDWKIIETTTDVFRTKESSQLIVTDNFYNLYCYPFNITIQNGTHRCPPKPFRLPKTISFKTAEHQMTASQMTASVIKYWDSQGIEALHHAHFDEESDITNEVKLIEELRE